MLLALSENEEFSKQENHPQRNAVNAPNRRVMVLLFRPGTKVSPGDWPCPKAETEQVSACKQRFWSDSDRRLANGNERRAYSDSHDTFACRFYDRLTNNSPCERTRENWVLRILVAGKGPLTGRQPLANERYTLTGLAEARPRSAAGHRMAFCAPWSPPTFVT